MRLIRVSYVDLWHALGTQRNRAQSAVTEKAPQNGNFRGRFRI